MEKKLKSCEVEIKVFVDGNRVHFETIQFGLFKHKIDDVFEDQIERIKRKVYKDED